MSIFVNFNELSLEIWARINEHWEQNKIDIPKKIVELTRKKVQIFTSNYTQHEKDLAREITSKLWEETLCNILWWKKAKKWNNKWFDIISNNWTRIEVKTWRIRNVAVIKDKQLNEMPPSQYFGLIFYRTKNNLPPSHFISICNWVSPISFLKRNIFIESVFLFPKSVLVYFYNTFDVNEREIWKTWVKYKPLWFTNAKILFDVNHWDFEKNAYERQHWKHNIQIYSLWYEL